MAITAPPRLTPELADSELVQLVEATEPRRLWSTFARQAVIQIGVPFISFSWYEGGLGWV